MDGKALERRLGKKATRELVKFIADVARIAASGQKVRVVYMSLKEKINLLIQAINKSDDNEKGEYLQAIETMIADCGKYIERVTAMEAAQATARFRMEADDYRDTIVRLDRSRKFAHDSMMIDVKLVDRICALMGVEKIYSGPDERILIADFAGQIAREYFEDRKL